MDTPSKMRLLYYFITLALFNLIVYFPSFFHTPRSDQLVYLANVAYQQDWVSLALKNYAMNRVDLPFNMKDDLLFRPIVYIFLGTEKWLFGYHFIYWQITGFLLHLAVLWFLLKLLLQTKESFFAFLLAAFFSILNAGFEMVIWSNVNSYLIFLCCILISLHQLRIIIKEGDVLHENLIKIIISLTVANFTYELGSFYCLLFAVYFYLSFNYKTTKILNSGNKTNFLKHKSYVTLTFCLPIILYLTFNFLDFFSRGLKLSPESQAILQVKDIAPLLHNILLTLLWWVYVGIFPSQCVTNLVQRTAIFPPFILTPTKGIFPIHGLNLIPIFPGVMVIFIYFFILYKGMHLNYFKDKWKILTLLLGMIISYSIVISFGRISQRGIPRILTHNAYYNYFAWVLFILFIYNSISFDYLKKDNLLTFLKRLGQLLLIILICINALRTFTFIQERTRLYEPFTILDKIIKNLIQQYGKEDNFSFGFDPSLAKKLHFNWVKTTNNPSGKDYHFIELLYPQYYTETMPKYLFFINPNGDLVWQEINYSKN